MIYLVSVVRAAVATFCVFAFAENELFASFALSRVVVVASTDAAWIATHASSRTRRSATVALDLTALLVPAEQRSFRAGTMRGVLATDRAMIWEFVFLDGKGSFVSKITAKHEAFDLPRCNARLTRQ